MKPSEEQWDVDGDADLEHVEYCSPSELDSREDEGRGDRSESAVKRVSEMLFPELQAALFF